MRVNRLVSIHLLVLFLGFGFHASWINTRRPLCALWKRKFCLQHMSQWMEANVLTMSRSQRWCKRLTGRHTETMFTRLNVQIRRRRNEYCHPNQWICLHLWLAPCFICFPSKKNKINTKKSNHNSSFKRKQTPISAPNCCSHIFTVILMYYFYIFYDSECNNNNTVVFKMRQAVK